MSNNADVSALLAEIPRLQAEVEKRIAERENLSIEWLHIDKIDLYSFCSGHFALLPVRTWMELRNVPVGADVWTVVARLTNDSQEWRAIGMFVGALSRQTPEEEARSLLDLAFSA